MKYVRTKEGIFEISKEYSNKDRIVVFYDKSINSEKGFSYDLPNNDIKLSDTIEELCDEFVIKYFSKIERKYIYLYLGKYEQLKNFNWKKDDDYYIYGAIRIKGEKGEPILKSVAKIKGVLPNGEINWKLL